MNDIEIVIYVDTIFGFFGILICLYIALLYREHQRMMQIVPVRMIRIPSWTELREESITICTVVYDDPPFIA